MARRSLTKRITIGLMPLVILAVGFIAAGVLVVTKPQLAAVEPEEKVWDVKAAAVEKRDLQPDLVFYGQVITGREVELRPLGAGRVIDVGPKFKNGNKVEKGDLLIAIDPFDYKIAVAEIKAELAEAEARLSELSTEIEASKAMLAEVETQKSLQEKSAARWARLRRQGAASTSAADNAEMSLLDVKSRAIDRHFDVKRLEASFRRQEAVIERLQVRLARGERDLAETELTAPFAGYITDIQTEVGRQVGQSDRVARLIDADRLEVKFHVGTQRFGEMMLNGGVEGRHVSVLWHLQGEPVSFSGEIARIGAEIDAQSGGIEVFAEISAAGSVGFLRPGAFVEVRVPGPRYREVVRLPETAWHDGSIFQIGEGVLLKTPATLVRRVGQDVLVRGVFDAAKPVLVTPIPSVKGGMKVQIVGEGA